MKTIAGTGIAGRRDGKGKHAQFDEPGGVSVAGDTIFVADTNNHAIRTVNARTGETKTLEIR